MNAKTARQGSGASVFMKTLCVCCVLLALLLLTVSALGEGLSWEERLERAREKYNDQTVNVYIRGRGKYDKNKINVRFYYSYDQRRDMNFVILESLQINDEAEMQAVLEVVAKHPSFSVEEYGTISFLKAEWITHNLAYDMANGNEGQKALVEMIAGEKLKKVIGRAKELDVSPLRNTSDQEMAVYELIEAMYCHPETGQDDP